MTLFLESVENKNVDTTKITQSLKAHKEEQQARLAAESALRSLLTQVLNSGMTNDEFIDFGGETIGWRKLLSALTTVRCAGAPYLTKY
ncbi:MAG: hypothetical protein EAZ88_05915 [Oscillatoriales cyanobacterium]|nr:MAG: hypothetical protein EAZ88_05915 [Oscillatoriales cyanobacterium]